MKQVLNTNSQAGSEKNQNEPRLIGEVLEEKLHSDEPFAEAYRKHEADVMSKKEENDEGYELFKDIFPNTELGVDLKLLTREPGRLPVGVMVPGAITRDGEDHFTFVEGVPKKNAGQTKRNPCILSCKYINIHRKDDGTLYPTFNRPAYTEEFTFQDFCRKASEELLAVVGLVEEE